MMAFGMPMVAVTTNVGMTVGNKGRHVSCIDAARWLLIYRAIPIRAAIRG
jgi:hypothetical protein